MRGFISSPVSWSNLGAGTHLFTATCDLSQDLSLFAGLEAALDYWARKKTRHLMPGRQDIDPVEMQDFLPRIALIDVLRNPLQFRYRLCGTGVCRFHPIDTTGLALAELHPHPYGDLLHEQYLDVVRTRRPAMHLNIFDSHDCYRSYAHLILPLSSDRQSVDMIMTVDSVAQDKAEMMGLLVHLQRRAGIEPGSPSLYGRNEPHKWAVNGG